MTPQSKPAVDGLIVEQEPLLPEGFDASFFDAGAGGVDGLVPADEDAVVASVVGSGAG